MISNSRSFLDRSRAIAALDADQSPIGKALRAALDDPHLAQNAGAAGGGIIIATINELARPDGGSALQIVVQQHAAAIALPAPDLNSAAESQAP